jgi:hypothetical protein
MLLGCVSSYANVINFSECRKNEATERSDTLKYTYNNFVFWLVTSSRLLVGSQRFGEAHCLHLQSRRENGGVCSSKTLVLAPPQHTQTPKTRRFIISAMTTVTI